MIEIGSVAVYFFVPVPTVRFIALALATTVKGNICHRRHTRNKSFVVAGVEQLAGTAQASVISMSVKRRIGVFTTIVRVANLRIAVTPTARTATTRHCN
jgi:hypothetical protein